MKLLYGNKCYVEVFDLVFLETIPKYIINEIEDENIFLPFVRFSDSKSISFFMDSDAIVDYLVVCGLSYCELDDMINSVYKKVDKISEIWLNSTIIDRNRLERSHSFNYSVKSYYHILDSLKKYKDNYDYYNEVVDNLKKKKVLQIL